MNDDAKSLDIRVFDVGDGTIEQEAELLLAFAGELVRSVLSLSSED